MRSPTCLMVDGLDPSLRWDDGLYGPDHNLRGDDGTSGLDPSLRWDDGLCGPDHNLRGDDSTSGLDPSLRWDDGGFCVRRTVSRPTR